MIKLEENERATIDELLEKVEPGRKDVVAALREGIGKRKDAKVLEDDAKQLRSDANALIKRAFEVLSITSVSGDDGSVTLTVSKRKTLDKKSLKKGLLDAGLSPTTVANLFEECTKETRSESIRYQKPASGGINPVRP